jgi:hypothetical protein
VCVLVCVLGHPRPLVDTSECCRGRRAAAHEACVSVCDCSTVMNDGTGLRIVRVHLHLCMMRASVWVDRSGRCAGVVG